jgi:hypothetical protein
MDIFINGRWRSEVLALDDVFLSLVVDYLGISLDLGMVFYYYAIIFSSQVLLCWELGGKYKGIHPHHSIHHFMLHLIHYTRVC